MRDVIDDAQGASRNPEARLEGEIVASLSTWAAEYETERLELGYAVAKALLGYIHRTQPPETVAEWCGKIADIFGEQATMLSTIVAEDRMHRVN